VNDERIAAILTKHRACRSPREVKACREIVQEALGEAEQELRVFVERVRRVRDMLNRRLEVPDCDR